MYMYIYMNLYILYIYTCPQLFLYTFNVYMYNPIFEVYLTLLCINSTGSHLYSPQRFGMSRDSKNL